MAKRRYRLEALLSLKQKEKKKAEIYLAKTILLLKKAKEELKKLEDEKKRLKEKQKEARLKMDEEMRGGGLIQKGCFHVNFLRKLKEDLEKKEEEIEDQKEVVLDCEQQAMKAKRDYIEAAKQLQVMEKHKELWEKKVRQELTRLEEKEMDELGQTIHSLRRWRGEKSLFQI